MIYFSLFAKSQNEFTFQGHSARSLSISEHALTVEPIKLEYLQHVTTKVHWLTRSPWLVPHQISLPVHFYLIDSDSVWRSTNFFDTCFSLRFVQTAIGFVLKLFVNSQFYSYVLGDLAFE